MLAIMALLASGGGAYYLGLLGGDALIDRLVTTPLPAESYEGWRLTAAPHRVDRHDPDPGEVSEIQAHLGNGDLSGGFVFTVFKTPAHARASFDGTANVDAEAAKLQHRFDLPSGAPVSCFGGSVCHALVGRTVVFVQMDRGTIDKMRVTIESLAAHVSRLDR